MINFLIVIAFLASFNAYAFKPGNCEESLDTAIKMVLINDVLGNVLETEPGDDYFINGHPNVCISDISKNNKLYSWLIHKNINTSVIIIERIDIKTFEKHYYGEFISEPKELKRHLINRLRTGEPVHPPYRIR